MRKEVRQQEMRGGWRGSKKVKMPQIEFDLEAIKEIKKRKKRVGKGYSKQSKPKGR
jgi:hypothetical protein